MYRGWIDCVRQNFHAHGVRGLQRGLSLGITREVAFNAVRIGLLDAVTEKVHATAAAVGLAAPHAPPGATERLLSGLTCGALGGCCVNPIEVLKTRFQAHGGLSGFQHRYAAAPAMRARMCRAHAATPCMCMHMHMHMHGPCLCTCTCMHMRMHALAWVGPVHVLSTLNPNPNPNRTPSSNRNCNRNRNRNPNPNPSPNSNQGVLRARRPPAAAWHGQ